MTEVHTTPHHRTRLFECVALLTFFLPAFFIFRTSISGDASIYFTFIKNFFPLPFSFHPSEVSFGATSPLHVVLHAPVHAILGEHWFAVSQLLNFLLLPTGVFFLNRALQGSWLTLMLMSALTLTATPLLIATGQLYESGLVFVSLSFLYYLLKQSRWWQAVFVAGLLYLVRPELLLVTLAVDAYVLFVSRQPVKCLLVALASFFPALIYHAYMFAHTEQVLPSSVVARGLRSLEDQSSWWDRARASFSQLLDPAGFIYILGGGSVLVLGLRDLRKHAIELITFLPLPLLFTFVPPQGYYIRYLLPVVPIAVAGTTIAVQALWSRSVPGRRWSHRVLAVLTVLGAVTVYVSYLNSSAADRRYDYDTLLLKDLSSQMNHIAGPQDKILIYEIQAQYYLSAHSISLDCIVGGQMLPVCQGKESVAESVRRNDIRYIVTMNSFNYRHAFDNTLLESLYLHDLSSDIGDTFSSDGILFTKILTNKAFSDPNWYRLRPWPNLNVGNELRVYDESQPLWSGHHPMWNSVYQVTIGLSTRTELEAQQPRAIGQ